MSTMRPDTDLLTTAQVAAIIGRNTRYVARLVDAGRLTPLTKLPGLRGAYLFRAVDVEAIDARRQQAS